MDDGGRLRLLTPLEHERLMGFPDNWTEGMSDEQRYKQAGNAVIVQVAQEIIRTLAECHANGGHRKEE